MPELLAVLAQSFRDSKIQLGFVFRVDWVVKVF